MVCFAGYLNLTFGVRFDAHDSNAWIIGVVVGLAAGECCLLQAWLRRPRRLLGPSLAPSITGIVFCWPCHPADFFLFEPVMLAVLSAVDLFRILGAEKDQDPASAIMAQTKPVDRSLEPWVTSPGRPVLYNKPKAQPAIREVWGSVRPGARGIKDDVVPAPAAGRNRRYRRSQSSEVVSPRTLAAFTPVAPGTGLAPGVTPSPTVGRV